jgi:hypothetical protein
MIEEVFKSAKGRSVLFLGRLKNFTEDEVKIFLKQYEVGFTTALDESVAVVIESTMLTPSQEEISYTVYKEKIPTFRLDEFERLYAQNITPNSLLMSLKLSNDQERLIRLLKNEAFEKTLYLKLFKLYDWKGEGVHESDENRDVTNTFVKRFYNPEQFMDPAMIYSPVTLMSIAAESEDNEVLDAMLTMPHYEIKISKGEKRPKTLKEMIAINPYSSQETLTQLARFKNQDIDYFLVHNDALPHPLQESIYERASYEIKKMLTQNQNLSDALFDKLLQEDEEIVSYLFTFAKIDKQRLEKIKGHQHFAILGDGEGIAEVLPQLLEIEDEALQYKLAENPLVEAKALQKIYEKYKEKVIPALCSNPNTPTIMIESFAKLQKYDEILAANPNTPTDILIAYFNRGEDRLNMALASNESMPIAYLQQFQLDPSLMHILSNNETFTKNILNGLGI